MGFIAAAISFLIGLLFAIPIFLQFMIRAIFKPSIFRRVERKVPPSCLLDPALGEHHYITTPSQVKFHYVAKGDPAKPLLLCVHGFPEFWYSFRYQLKAMSDKYRVVAIDLRGYGDSDKPKGKQNYTIDLLSQDIKEIVEALGYSSCILTAHDWGGAIAWNVAHRYPEIVDKLIIFNAPHFGVFRKYLKSHWSQLKKSWYMFFFQVPFVPELMLQADDMMSLKMMMKNLKNNTEEDLEAFKYTFGQPGAFTPPINYYRSMFSATLLPRGSYQKKITAPVLVVWGTNDMALEKGLTEGMEAYVNNLTIKYIEGASHWVQQEEPELCNTFMRQFLETH